MIATGLMSPTIRQKLTTILSDFAAFSRACYPAYALRAYQLEAARPILAAIEASRGGDFVIEFARQAGKDELLAQLQAFLMARYRIRGGQVVMAAPTYKPQCMISRRRLTQRLRTPLHPGARPSEGYRVQCGEASSAFLSTEESANVRGETASLALIANEAQDISTSVFDSRFAPMTASTNAPAIYSGTPWTEDGLLSRQARAPRSIVFKADWEAVAAELPAYGEHVRSRIAQLGERHPHIRTEYFLEELGSEGGLFAERRRAQMQGKHPRQVAPTEGKQYALLLDVAGEDEDAPPNLAAWSRERQRDSVALTVVEVDETTVKNDLLRLPSYKVVDRREWVGQRHSLLVPHVLDLVANVWRARWLIVDATGAGVRLAAPLTAALLQTPCEVESFIFTQATKSKLGWDYLAAIESGRYKEYVPDGAADTGRFWAQVENCDYSVQIGPGQVMKWGVPEGRGHDDLLLSAALVGVLEQKDWRPRTVSSRTYREEHERVSV